VAKRGVPKKLFVDNGKIYKSKQMEFICASLGTVLAFARPFRPEANEYTPYCTSSLLDDISCY
jgi:transposase